MKSVADAARKRGCTEVISTAASRLERDPITLKSDPALSLRYGRSFYDEPVITSSENALEVMAAVVMVTPVMTVAPSPMAVMMVMAPSPMPPMRAISPVMMVVVPPVLHLLQRPGFSLRRQAGGSAER